MMEWPATHKKTYHREEPKGTRVTFWGRDGRLHSTQWYDTTKEAVEKARSMYEASDVGNNPVETLLFSQHPFPKYLKLLQGKPYDAGPVVQQIKKIGRGPNLSWATTALASFSWKRHLAACAILSVDPTLATREHIDLLWAHAARSWVSPQIAVTLYFVDSDFTAMADKALQSHLFSGKTKHAVAALTDSPSDNGWAEPYGRKIALQWKTTMVELR